MADATVGADATPPFLLTALTMIAVAANSVLSR